MLRKLPVNGSCFISLFKKPYTEIVVYRAPETQITKTPEIDPALIEALKKKHNGDFFKLGNAQEVTFDSKKIKQLAAELEETKKHSVY